ncbi:hypothetical protein ACQEVU_37185 [Dactylosporangium sp. CA-139066]
MTVSRQVRVHPPLGAPAQPHLEQFVTDSTQPVAEPRRQVPQPAMRHLGQEAYGPFHRGLHPRHRQHRQQVPQPAMRHLGQEADGPFHRGLHPRHRQHRQQVPDGLRRQASGAAGELDGGEEDGVGPVGYR